MFDIGAAELLVIVITAIVVIGPKEMPRALRTAGRWIGKMRRMSNHFRTGLDAMIREAEMEEAEKEWRERNREIMARSGGGKRPRRTVDQASPAFADRTRMLASWLLLSLETGSEDKPRALISAASSALVKTDNFSRNPN